MFKTSLAVALILAAAPASVAAADRVQPPPTRTVFHGDLNLATEAGVKALDRRIRRAARQLCNPRDPLTALIQHRCRAAAQASAAALRSARIAAAREGRTGLAAGSR